MVDNRQYEMLFGIEIHKCSENICRQNGEGETVCVNKNEKKVRWVRISNQDTILLYSNQAN